MELIPSLETELPLKDKKSLALQKAGLTTDKVAASLASHLEATLQTTVYDDMGRASTLEVPNYPVQEKAQEKLIRVMELVKPETSSSPTVVNIGVTSEDIKKLIQTALEVKEQVSRLRIDGRQTGEVIDVSCS